MSTARTAEQSAAMEHALRGVGFLTVQPESFPDPCLAMEWLNDDAGSVMQLYLQPCLSGWYFIVRAAPASEAVKWKGINLGIVKTPATVLRVVEAFRDMGLESYGVLTKVEHIEQ